jgi:hypothetical protein
MGGLEFARKLGMRGARVNQNLSRDFNGLELSTDSG